MRQSLNRTATLALSFLLSILFLVAVKAQGQTELAQLELTGRITDSRGAAVSGAQITLTANKQTAGTATAGDDGRFSIKLAPGEFQIRVTAMASAAIRSESG